MYFLIFFNLIICVILLDFSINWFTQCQSHLWLEDTVPILIISSIIYCVHIFLSTSIVLRNLIILSNLQFFPSNTLYHMNVIFFSCCPSIRHSCRQCLIVKSLVSTCCNCACFFWSFLDFKHPRVSLASLVQSLLSLTSYCLNYCGHFPITQCEDWCSLLVLFYYYLCH